MERSANIRFLDDVLTTQRQMYRVQLWLAAGLVIVGVVLIVLGSFLAGVVLPDYWKWLLTLGGTFVASLSSLRVNDFFGAKGRLAALVQLRLEFERSSTGLNAPSPEEIVRLRERVEKLYDKTLGL